MDRIYLLFFFFFWSACGTMCVCGVERRHCSQNVHNLHKIVINDMIKTHQELWQSIYFPISNYDGDPSIFRLMLIVTRMEQGDRLPRIMQLEIHLHLHLPTNHSRYLINLPKNLFHLIKMISFRPRRMVFFFILSVFIAANYWTLAVILFYLF